MNPERLRHIWGILVIASLLSVNTAWSVQLETLMMPGPVIEGHADYEAECSRCHTRFSKKSQTRLCLDCHEEIDRDIAGSTGYHGRLAEIAKSECMSCHSDHEGRDADIVHLNKESFDHSLTDFVLEGSHRTVTCIACHERAEPFSNAPSDCHTCHREQDPHKGELGKHCESCHQSLSWGTIRFDHSSTDFPLKGKHRDTECAGCHGNEHYDNTPERCSTCHQLDDVHDGSNGTDCASCHTPADWKKTSFDHDNETDFPLRGKHELVPCDACHTRSLKSRKPESDCYSCHRHDDVHHGRYGSDCSTCHSSSTWKKFRFDHDASTDFPLRGTHRDTPCILCHQGDIRDGKPDIACLSCHRIEDVHKGQQGTACQNCHNEVSWRRDVIFDHGLTRFPLLGLHATVPCEECHLSAEYQDAARDCISCHEGDDNHNGGLGTDCQQCHSPNAWGLWIFDHAEQTGFRLEGAHEDLACKDCHAAPAKTAIRQSSRCGSCHRRDDIHEGSFGPNCGRCHSSDSFSDARPR